MKTTKISVLFSLMALAASPALLAAEPNISTPTEPPKAAALEDVAEQAALVQQLGQEASRGFDPEAHAHFLRAQIESLLSPSTAAKASVPRDTPAVAVAPAGSTAKPSVSSAPTTPVVPLVPQTQPPLPRDAAVRETLQKMHAVLDELEVQLNGTRKSQ